MKTKDSPDQVTELPPAPAPTARSANRWPLSGGHMDGHGRRRGARTPRHAEATPPAAQGPDPGMRKSLLQGAAAPIMLALAMGVIAFLRGRGGDSFEDYRGLLIALAVVAFLVISRVGARRSKRHRDRGAGR